MKYLLLYAFSFSVSSLIAQTLKDNIDITCLECDALYNRICYENRKVFGAPDFLAEFPKGDKELIYFVKNTLRYPKDCIKSLLKGVL